MSDSLLEAQDRIQEAFDSRSESLDLSHLQLHEVPKTIGQLTNLTKLFLEGNQLSALPESISRLTNLTTLTLDDNQLRVLPESIGLLTKLTTLNLDDNQLRVLPESIGLLTNLATLHLDDNQLRVLPKSIGLLTNLSALFLGVNQLSVLPESITRLTNLATLHLDDNQLRVLPESITRLTNLSTLTLDDNQLRVLPKSIGLLTNLKTLFLQGNQLRALPQSIGLLTNLSALFLGVNQLRVLPESITQLKNLTMLNLRFNQLRALPQSIGLLTNLKTLHLQGNKLRALPESITQLKNLTILDLQGNQLSALPESIGQLTNLRELYLHGNPRLGLPEELLGPTYEVVRQSNVQPHSPQKILSNYFRSRGEAGQPLNECKIIVVGRGGAGKTSLIKRLAGEPFDQDESETHGINLRNLTFSGTHGNITGRVWDFGGQIILHSMHQFFLTKRSLYLLVLGDRDDMIEKDAQYWLQLIRSYAAEAPVIVILNKSAGRTRQFAKAEMESKFGPILGWLPTECSNDDPTTSGIRAVKEKLAEILHGESMESARRNFPKKWIAIKNEMEQMTESYLEFEEFVKRCEHYHERTWSEQIDLAENLHDLGIALNYRNDPRLCDTTVLKPDWIANGIYAVLRANDVDQKILRAYRRPLATDAVIDGKLLETIHEKAQAWQMLKVEDYPEQKRDFLLRMMESFDLSYPLEPEGKQWIVPTLLPPDPPKGTDEPQEIDGGNDFRLRFEFDVIPAPLIVRLIAKLFALIPDRKSWQRGTMLSFDDVIGRVWTTPQDKYLFVTVVSPKRKNKDDRSLPEYRLLAMVRGTVKLILREYQALKPVEQWKYKDQFVPREFLEEFGVLPKEESQDHRRKGDEE